MIKRLIKNDGTVGRGFYTLFVFNGILDIMFLLEEYVSFRPAQLGLFKEFYTEIFPKYLIAGACYTYSICQAIVMSFAGLTITFNRYFCIKYPLQYHSFWEGWRLILLTIYPVFVVCPLFIYFYQAKVDYIEDETKRLTVIFVDPQVNNLLWSTAIYTQCITLIVNAILNVMLFKICRVESKKIYNKKMSAKLDISMAKIAFVFFSTFALLVIIEVTMTISINMENYTLANDLMSVIPLCQSLLIFSPLYTLLFLSSDLRTQFLSSIRLNFINSYITKKLDKNVTKFQCTVAVTYLKTVVK